MKYKCLLFLVILVFSISTANAQKSARVVQEQCGTMQRLELKFQRNPALRARFEQQRSAFKKIVKERINSNSTKNAQTARVIYTIPVVFHIVLTNPTVVTDAQIQAQLDTLNRDFAGSNGDSVVIPDYFKPLFGKSGIQFCMAQRTPDGENTNGIERITTTHLAFSADDAVKHASSGGADIWDNSKYFNVWICALSNGLLGYSTFPDSTGTESSAQQGTVVEYRSLPGGTFTNYNTGKTLSHETGHYFNLFHIWGDDKGECTGTDDVDDTPNQADASSGCYSGVRTDACAPDGDGILYQNYMDYTNDNCLVMFTNDQVIRMESALVNYRSSLLTSDGCTPPIPKNYDAQLKSVNNPSSRVCTTSFAPSVTIRNNGINVLTSLNINYKIDNGKAVAYKWTGSLTKPSSLNITLDSITSTSGNHLLTVYISNPDNKADEDLSTDTLTTNFQYYPPVAAISESFESPVFPPAGWDILNPDNSITWERVTGFAKTGNASVKISNFNYNIIGATDELRLPQVNFGAVDSAFLSFQVAAAVYTDLQTTDNNWDTLQVLVSTDCGQTYTSLYNKYAATLVTRTAPTETEFEPTSSEWRKDSINLTDYIGKGNIIISFRNSTGYENDIYLDDINLRTVNINPNLKKQGFLITPNPTNGVIAVQFYPQPSNLKAIQIYNLMGQKISEVLINELATNYYSFDINKNAPGTYIVRVVYSDKVITKKIIKF